ncbi:MAG TPA: tRNA(His) guanylyltransferase Thg1 family protein [Pirellulaceae bacterium]|jgi:tRNA(His) 5'-end guanylyltransferase|nr:tRNA(His) guanylyltransferase Thg1 family protein [Pirellulaceae bacterium]
MLFDELDRKMRVFETAADYCVLPDMFMVARLDGRSFTRLTKDVCRFEAPFDPRFRDLMVAAAEALMTSGFRVVYSYTQSDEISLLFAQGEKQYARKLRKYDSTLAAEASARFSLALGQVATFDCRISQLPNVELVVDYFRWRSEDAARNALNAHCYWTLRKQGRTEREATDRIDGLSVSSKNELLYRLGLNFNDVPAWQKRGVGLYWEEYERSARNQLTGAESVARRRRIRKDLDLPMKGEYGEFVRGLVLEDVGARRSRP